MRWLLLCVGMATSGCASAETMSTVSQAIVVFGSIVTAVAGGSVLYYGKKHEREKDAVTSARDSESSKREVELKRQVDDLVAKAERIQVTADAVQSQLKPFEDLAQRFHPTLPVDKALAELRVDIETLKADVETEKTARTELQERLKPRALQPAQEAALRKAVAELGTGYHFSIQTLIGDSEAQAYAERIAGLFTAAGCDVSGSGVDAAISASTMGLTIAVPPPPGQVAKDAQWLAEVLSRSGFSFEIKTRADLKGSLQLIVGAKPKP